MLNIKAYCHLNHVLSVKVSKALRYSALAVLLSIIQASAAVTVTVPSGGDLQAALNAAQPGDTIILTAGATYKGNFKLSNHGGTTPVTIRTSALGALPPAGARITPAYAQHMPKLVALGSGAALNVSNAHYYNIVGIEFLPSIGTYSYNLIDIGPATSTSVGMLSSNITLDRVYIHGDPVVGVKRGITLNGRNVTIRDSWISGITSTSQETQAIAGWNGPGPYQIVNNYLEASGENIMFGGAVPAITKMVPCDIQIRQNHLYKLLSWNPEHTSYAGKKWVVKNLLELKNGCRIDIDSNLFENNWIAAQNGMAVVFTPRTEMGKASWAVVQNVRFRNNIIRNSPGGMTILGTDGSYGGKLSNVEIRNNLLDRVGEARLFGLYNGASSVTIDHNTAVAPKTSVVFAEGAAMSNLVLTNNIFNHGSFGIVGTATATGTSTLSKYFPGAQVARNVFIGGPAASYPTNNYFPATLDLVGFLSGYVLSTTSTYNNAGTDGTDIGCNREQLIQIESAARSGTSSWADAPAPDPTPTPTPSPKPVPTGLSLSAVSLYPSEVTGTTALASQHKVVLAAAPTSPVTVSLASSRTDVARVPASVTVPAGTATALFTIQTPVAVSAPVNVTISATLNGVAKTATLTVAPARLSVLTLYPAKVTGGATAYALNRVYLNAPAAAATTVTLSSTNPSVANPPATVTVPAGQSSVLFAIPTTRVSGDTPVVILASQAGVTRSQTLTVMVQAPPAP